MTTGNPYLQLETDQRKPIGSSSVFTLGVAATTLLGASCILTVLIGDIGFQGDDWWILSFPYWNRFPQSVVAYAQAALRPVEGLYWIGLFEAFGIHRHPYLFASLGLNVLSSILFALCVVRLFPKNIELGVWAAFFSFFMPMSSPLVFIMHTDNSRLAMIFFLASVMCMQSAISGTSLWLGLAVICYLLSVLTYENASMLIFALPLLVLPLVNKEHQPILNRCVFRRTALVIAVGFLGFLVERFLLFSGGAVNHAGVVPSLTILLSYGWGLIDYLYAPWKNMTFDAWSLIFGAAIGVILFALLKCQNSSTLLHRGIASSHNRSMLLLIGAGAGVFLLGIGPYVLAGYSAGFGFTGQSRIYSSGGFGIAMMLGAIFSLQWSSGFMRRMMNLSGVLLIAVMASFQCDLRKDWQAAAEIRKNLCKSLITIAPDLTDHTTLLFLDLQSYIGERAVIFQGVDGLDQYVKMLYNNRTLHGFFLYTRMDDASSGTDRQAIISPEGVGARGSAPYGPARLDTIIILRFRDRSFSLVKSLSREDSFLDAQWEGVSRVSSRTARIISANGEHGRQRRCLY